MQPLGENNNTEQSSMMNNEQPQMPPQRRRSLWDRISAGAFNASQVDFKGMRAMDATGFAPTGAKFDETFGSSALYETTLNRPKRDDAWKRERNALAEDALRQMS
ncbi:hypothetical protein K492DRAFT_220650 [Lichtheimia hyalospora FSU 10163]|nr:hypothetical protein K492DRAFT_220650 [Lichtheimia hyalospora FSU 10163]